MMLVIEISSNKIVHAYYLYLSFPHLIFEYLLGYQTPKRLARAICLQIKNSKTPRKIHQETRFQKSSKTLAKLEYMKYVVCTESFEGAGTL